jgi:ketosteroid isomerase-like protein
MASSAKGKDKDGKPTSFSGIATHVFERQSDSEMVVSTASWQARGHRVLVAFLDCAARPSAAM